MDSIAPGPKKSPRAVFRQTLGIGAIVMLSMGLAPFVAPALVAAMLAAPMTVRALGATLLATGLMQVAVGRAAGRGRLRPAGVVASLIGSALVGVGAAKVIWPAVSPPLSGAFGGRGGAVALLAGGSVLAAMALGIKKTLAD